MPVPSYGAAPLAKTFLLVRMFQFVAFVCIVGLLANFVAQIVAADYVVAKEIVGTLTVTSLATLYCLITIPFFLAEANLGLLIMAGFDFLLLIAFIVIAVVLGRPLSYLNCYIIDNMSTADDGASAFAFTQSIGQNLGENGSFVGWTGATQANCFESKAVWGMSIALCILFACSCLLLPALFAKQKRASKIAAKASAGWGP